MPAYFSTCQSASVCQHFFHIPVDLFMVDLLPKGYKNVVQAATPAATKCNVVIFPEVKVTRCSSNFEYCTLLQNAFSSLILFPRSDSSTNPERNQGHLCTPIHSLLHILLVRGYKGALGRLTLHTSNMPPFLYIRKISRQDALYYFCILSKRKKTVIPYTQRIPFVSNWLKIVDTAPWEWWKLKSKEFSYPGK